MNGEGLVATSRFFTIMKTEAPEAAIIGERIFVATQRNGPQVHNRWGAARGASDTGLARDPWREKSVRTESLVFTVSYDHGKGLLVGQYSGGMDFSLLRRYAMRAVTLGDPYNTKRFLNDLREARFNTAKLALNDTLGLFDALSVDRSWTRAILVKQKSRHQEMIEDLASESGYTIRIFTDASEAEGWLKTMR